MTIGATTASSGAFTTVTASTAIGTASGGTGLTSFTSGGVVYASSTSALATGSALYFSGTNLGINTTLPTQKLQVNGTGRFYTGSVSTIGAVASSGLLIDGAGSNGNLSQIGFGYDAALTYMPAAIYGITTTQSGNTAMAIGFATRDVTTDTQPTERVRITQAGNFGVGTTNPTAKQQITSTSAGAATVGLFLNNNSATTSTEIRLAFAANSNDSIADNRYSYISALNTSGSNGQDLVFATNASGGVGTEKLRIDSAGNLGLGIAPSAWGSNWKAFQFGYTSGIGQLAATSTASGEVTIASATYNNNTNWLHFYTGVQASRYSQTSGQHQWFTAGTGTAGGIATFTQAMTLDADGDLGIGITSPATKIDARLSGTSSGAVITVGNTGSGPFGGIAITDGGAYPVEMWASALVFKTGNSTYASATERARITSGGYFKASNAGTYFNSTGSYHELRQTANSQGVNVSVTNASFTSESIFSTATKTAGTDWMHFYGTSDANTVANIKIFGNGNIQNANNSYGSISDSKLKENIVDASPKLADLMQVKVRNYNLIGSTTKQIGVVAQELETVFPAMVDESHDRDAENNVLETTTKSVKYSVFVPMLIKAMQEQQAIIESLKARLDAANL